MAIEVATLAGGCFWCLIEPFDTRKGVESIVSGYAGGDEVNPKYEDVKYQRTGHVESVQITFDNERISFKEILDVYWTLINPTDDSGQFDDRGDSYRAMIFYHNNEQKLIAEQSKASLQESGRFADEIVTPIVPYKNFYLAEEYHQDFYKKSPERYKQSHEISGRDEFKKQYWGEK
ncbi:peptide-methionine (S)-S-oxide reductase MsrA [Carnobacteriaceae bacterium zg-ZUI252]|nr:peptide-methionine (S)-S-oxide reductase MsrA [Carnobacteriaceae bacterium zg-ZUI252]MBS4770137.1 peptide-methionine (S)-S-oxide reductase MsrA [Carnobacteriaceae bacterium zg-ZUI240]